MITEERIAQDPRLLDWSERIIVEGMEEEEEEFKKYGGQDPTLYWWDKMDEAIEDLPQPYLAMQALNFLRENYEAKAYEMVENGTLREFVERRSNAAYEYYHREVVRLEKRDLAGVTDESRRERIIRQIESMVAEVMYADYLYAPLEEA